MGIIKRVQIQIKTTIITKIRIKITKKNIKVGTTEIIQNVQTAKMTFHPDGYCENCGYGKSANEDGANHSSECANCGSATINDDGTCPYCGYQN